MSRIMALLPYAAAGITALVVLVLLALWWRWIIRRARTHGERPGRYLVRRMRDRLRPANGVGIRVEVAAGLFVAVIALLVVVVLLLVQDERAALKFRLIEQARSTTNSEAVRAIDELRDQGWLFDGSLHEGDLWAANLRGANLQSASLRGANLFDANLADANLRYADLTGANLGNTRSQNLAAADLQAANLFNADLRSADLRFANLNGTDLWAANLQDANLFSASLRGASLSGADLRGADLRFADLQGADLWTAELQGANLYEANLRGITSGETLLWSMDETTILPDGGRWSDVVDLRRFSDPDHPQFWRSDDPFSPAYVPVFEEENPG